MSATKTLAGFILIGLTIMCSSCGGGSKDIDGNNYLTVKIGNQIWMAENLNVSHFRNGDSIPEARSAEEWIRLERELKPAWCVHQNASEDPKKYGKLYNWYAVNDKRGLAPDGWHIPSDEEWSQMVTYMGGEVLAALKMRTTGSSENVSESGDGGFMGLPGGGCRNDGTFFGFGSYGYWWSSTEITASGAWIRLLDYVNCNVYSKSYNKYFGLSVRCIKNQ
jgi:uncharacterized protein (TIGR02145 family)